MKQGRSLQDLAAEITRQAKTKRDFIAPMNRLEMTVEDQKLLMHMGNGHGEYQFGVGETAHEQLADRLRIPRDYYERMRTEQRGLLCENVNTWMRAQKDRVMVRTLDAKVRAILSPKYRPLDNIDLAEAILPRILDHKWEIKSCELTERRLYLKVVSEEIRVEFRHPRLNVTHIIHPGVTIMNSEIGLGSVRFEPTVHHEHCLNLVAIPGGLRKAHVGREHDIGIEEAEEFFKDETRRLSDKAFWAKCQDVLDAMINQETFRKTIERLEQAAEDEITGDPVKVVEEVTGRFGLMQGERTSVLTWLIRDGDLSRYGMMNAITRASQAVADYDRATDLERIGGQVLELPRREWEELAAVG